MLNQAFPGYKHAELKNPGINAPYYPTNLISL